MGFVVRIMEKTGPTEPRPYLGAKKDHIDGVKETREVTVEIDHRQDTSAVDETIHVSRRRRISKANYSPRRGSLCRPRL
jgi:hypothetical protein